MDEDKNTGKWQGVHWRFHPHAPKKFTKQKWRFPSVVYFKRDAKKEIYSTNNLKERFFFDGQLGMEVKKDEWIEFGIKKEGDKKITVTLTTSTGVKQKKTYEYPSTSLMPKKIDTFAIAEPNLRGYRYLKMWDYNSGSSGKKMVVQASSDDLEAQEEVPENLNLF